MRTASFSYSNDGYDVVIVVSGATLGIAIERDRLLRQQDEQIGANAETLLIWSWQCYSEIIAATISVENAPNAEFNVPWQEVSPPDLPMTFEQFMNLPETLVLTWRDKVHALSPHWAPWREQAKGSSGDMGGAQSGEVGGGNPPPSNEI